jgi:Protein of unknown function (DUF1194)
MRRRHLIAATAGLALPATAEEAVVDLLLVLAMDASGSIDDNEFHLQRQGYAEALTAPEVLAAIGNKPQGAIAVAVVEWGSPGSAVTVVPWTRVADAASAWELGQALLVAERSQQTYNAIGDALTHATQLIAAAPFRAAEKVIDLSGDGPDMRSHHRASEARDAAVAAGITVNALAVTGGGHVVHYGEPLPRIYEREVIGGPGAFVAIAESRRDIARALRGKLVREIA